MDFVQYEMGLVEYNIGWVAIGCHCLYKWTQNKQLYLLRKLLKARPKVISSETDSWKWQSWSAYTRKHTQKKHVRDTKIHTTWDQVLLFHNKLRCLPRALTVPKTNKFCAFPSPQSTSWKDPSTSSSSVMISFVLSRWPPWPPSPCFHFYTTGDR